MTCAEYLSAGNGAQWRTLSECRISFEGFGSVKDEQGRVEAYYAPLLSVNEAEARSSILVRGATRQDFTDRLSATEFTGLVQFGIENDSRVREAFTGSGLDIARDFVILELGMKPELGMSATLLTMGLLSGLWCYRRVRQSASQVSTDKLTPAGLVRDATDPPFAEP